MRAIIAFCVFMLIAPAFAQQIKSTATPGKQKVDYATCMARIQKQGVPPREAANRCSFRSRTL